MKISYKAWAWLGFVIAVLNGVLCVINVAAGKPLFAGMSGAASIMGAWSSRALVGYYATRLSFWHMKRVAIKQMRRIEEEIEWRNKLIEDDRKRNEGKK